MCFVLCIDPYSCFSYTLVLGVHALKNTFHVDIRRQVSNRDDEETVFCTKLQRGLNYYLSKQKCNWDSASRNNSLTVAGRNFTARILNAAPAPDTMNNDYHQDHPEQPPVVDWNARFSATQRTYIYRVMFLLGGKEWGIPFEFDRSWSVRLNHRQLDVAGMQQAAGYLEGTNDFSSFRAAHCQRASPIVTVNEITVRARPCGNCSSSLYNGFDNDNSGQDRSLSSSLPDDAAMLVTIRVVGNRFVYRQVRNMVGCLIEVGRGKLRPSQVNEILKAKDRTVAPCMAPAHGLFLVDVRHGDFLF